MNDEKIKEIQQELKQLSQKQVELSKAHQQRVKSYEEQKTLYQHLFGQPPLPPDPELESVKEDKRRLYDILQAAASIPPPVPEKDWSKSPLYSKTVQKLTGATTPFEQYGLYGSIIGGVFLISRSLFRSYHVVKAIEFPPGSEDRSVHSYLAGATKEQLHHAQIFARRLRTRGILGGILLPIGFITYLVQKHKYQSF